MRKAGKCCVLDSTLQGKKENTDMKHWLLFLRNPKRNDECIEGSPPVLPRGSSPQQKKTSMVASLRDAQGDVT